MPWKERTHALFTPHKYRHFYLELWKISERSTEETYNLTKARIGTGKLYTVQMERNKPICAELELQRRTREKTKPISALAVWPPPQLCQGPSVLPGQHHTGRSSVRAHGLGVHPKSRPGRRALHFPTPPPTCEHSQIGWLSKKYFCLN